MLILANELPASFVFGMDVQTFWNGIAQLVNFLILAFLLTWLLYKPVREFLASRAQRIKSQFSQAKSEMEDANKLKLEYQEKMQEIESHKNEILDSARRNATEAGRQVLAEARKEADDALSRARASIEMEKERAHDEMRREIVEVAAAISGKFLGATVDKGAHDKLFDETMAELEATAWRV